MHYIGCKFFSGLLLSIICFNFLILTITSNDEDFWDSDAIVPQILRGLGLEPKKHSQMITVPLLLSSERNQFLRKEAKQTEESRKNLDLSDQTNTIPLNDSKSFSGDSANNQNSPRIRPPLYAMGGSYDGKIGIYDSAWDYISGTTISVNLNSSGSNLMAIAILGMNNRDYLAEITSVTFNGDPLTNLGAADEAEDAHVSIWYLKNPDKGTGLSFSITFNESLYYSEAAAAWFAILEDVNQTNTFGPVETYTAGTSNDTQLVVTSTSGDRVFGAVAGETTGHWSVLSPSTELYSYDEASYNRVNTAAANGNATGSSYTLHWTAPSRDHVAAIGVAIHPFIDTTPPIINDFGVDDPGTGTGTFWANITDTHSDVDSALIKINDTNEYSMSSNGTHWIKQLTVDFGKNYEYQIVNASDLSGNYISSSSSTENHTFNLDKVTPNVLNWKYVSANNTFQANVTDSWGNIDTVIVNVTTHTLTANMVYYKTFSGTQLAYMNNTLSMPNGPIDFLISVNDTSGNQFSSTTHSGNVYSNTPPVASNVTLSRDQFQELLPIFSNSTLHLKYNYSDAESQGESGTEIRWYKDSGTGFILQMNRNDSTSIPESALLKGDQWYASVKPKDGEEFGDLVNSSIITVKNTPPQISSVIISPSSPVTTQQLMVSNTTTDPDGDSIIDYEIRWFNPNLNSSYANLSIIPSTQTIKGETWWCELRAFDGTNYSVWIKSNNITIQNTSPVASSLAILPSTPKTHQTLTASYVFSDADGDSESGSLIRWYKNGELQGTLNDSLTVDSGLTLKGETWYFTITPSDGSDYGGEQPSSSVTVENTAPVATDLQLSPGSPQTTNSLTANYTFSDNDSDSDTGSLIIWYKNNVLQGALNDSDIVTSSYTTKGDIWHFKVRPSDGTDYGNWIGCPTNVTIENTEPSASNAYISPSSPKTGDDLTANYDYSDPDSDLESGSEIIWYLNGTLQGALNNSFTIGAENTLKNEEWHFKIRPKDGDDFGVWVGSTNITIENTAPVANSLAILLSTPKTHHTLTASYAFSDADGDSESGSLIRWYKNGVLQGTLNGSLTVDSSLTSKGENWYFTITPSDGSDSGSLAQSTTAVIGNSAPEAINLQITPGSPQTANSLTADYTFSDNDSDSDTGSLIIWYKNNVLQGSMNDSDTVSSTYTTKGDIWHFKVRPSDGIDYGIWVSCPINATIGNTEPSASNGYISPSNPKTGDDLVANYDYSDPDSDLESGSEIIWYLNGTLQGALNNSFTIGAGNTLKNEEWHFKIRPKDGSDFGVWIGSTNITIGNTVPVANSLAILPSTPKTHHNLTASYAFSDADGDSESGSLIRWYKNGVLQGTLNDSLTVDSSLTSKGETWYFTITPSDGSDSGSLVQCTIIIIGNSAPEAINLQITPGSPQTVNSLTANYIFSDNDTDSDTDSLIIWYKNNVLQGALNDSKTVSSTYTTKGDVWHVKVRPSDGTDYGAWVSCPINVTIENTEPVATDLQITPASPITSDTLIATYTWTDNDTGDSNTGTEIRWYKNGTLQINLNDTLTIAAGNTSKNDIWHFKVRPSDGIDLGGWYSCSINVTIGNRPPQVTNVKINETSPVAEDSDLHVLYTYSDYDNDLQDNNSRQIRWYKTNATETYLMSVLNDSMTVGWGNTSSGDIWYFTIQVSDGENLSSLVTSPSVSIVIPPNQIPVASNLNFSISNPTTLDYLYINWTYSDGNGDPESGSMYYWYRNGEYLSQYDGLRNLSSSATAKGDVWYVEVKPRDGKDFGNIVRSDNITIENTPPSATDLVIIPASPKTGNDLVATYIFSDIDNDADNNTRIIWYKNNVLQGSLNGSIIIAAGNTSKTEKWHFKVRPYDGTDFGAWVSCPINVTIINTAPSASNLAITPSGAKTANDLTASYSFTDVDSGDSESNSIIRWYKNGVLQGALNDSLTVDSSLTSKGENWFFTITPSDGSDFGTLKTSVAILILNTAPSASSLTISPSTPRKTDSLIASYTWTDPDNATDTESGSLILWYKDGVLQGTLNNSITVSSSYLSKGEKWHFKVLPKDGLEFGSWVSCPTNVTIINSVPTASGLAITPVGPKTTNDLTASYTFSDVDTDSESGSEIVWYLDGVLQGVLNGSTTVQAGNTSKEDIWHFKVRPNDGTEFGAWVSCPINVTIINTAPSASNLAITPSDAKTANDLTASYSFTDVDSGDSESNSLIRWFRNSVELTSLENLTTIPAVNTSKGQTWYFTIQPSDGNDFGALKTSAVILILNTAPMASGLTISPSTPRKTDSLIASYTWTDPDNATDTDIGSLIRWYKDGVLQGALNNSITVSSSYLSKGEEWHFKVQPKDGSEFGSWVSCPTNVTIINSVPTASGLAITPVDPKTTNDLTASYTFSDVDTDSESGSEIIWYLDGILQGALNGSTTVQLGNTTKDDVWHFKVRPSDGTDFGTWVSCPINVTIANSRPSASNLQLNPTNPITGDDLLASYSFYDVDLDDDNGTQIRWFKNGVLQGNLNDSLTVGSTFTNKGENWYYTITPSDGTEFGNVKTSSIRTIGNTPPSVSNLAFTPVVPIAGNDLKVTYDWIDADNDAPSGTQFRWYRNNIFQSTYNDSDTIPGGLIIKGENWTVSIRASDGMNTSTLWENASIIIGNSAPSVTSAVVSPTDPRTTDDLEVSLSAFDIDSDPIITYSIEWLLGGSDSFPQFDNLTTLPAVNTVKGDSWSIRVKAYDGEDWSEFLYSGGRTILNTKPSVTNVTLTGGTTTAENLTLSYDFYDIDGDPSVGTTITWRYIGFGSGTHNDLLEIPASYTKAGQQWWVEITPKDSDGAIGQTFNSWDYGMIIIIGNTPPTITDITINGEFNGTESGGGSFGTVFNLNLHYNVTDIDGDEGVTTHGLNMADGFALGSEYRWYRNRSGIVTLMSVLNDQTSVPFYFTEKDDIWWVQVHPRDFYGDFGVSVNSSKIDIGNTAPQLKDYQWEIGIYYTINDLSFNYTFFDYDTDDVERGINIQWYRNGIHVLDFDNNMIIPSKNTTKDETWFARIQVWDGEDYSRWYQLLNITILNSKPTAINFNVLPYSPNTTQNLYANWTFLDSDGDSENYTMTLITWYRNGIRIDSLSNIRTVPASNTNRDDSWYFIVQVSDGSNYSTSYVSPTILIINSIPSVSNIQINSGVAMIYTTDALTVTWEFNDTDPLDVEDLASVLIIWSLNGVNQSQFTNDTSIPANYIEKGQQWQVFIKVRDNGGLWSELTNSPSVVIANSQPNISLQDDNHPEFIIEDEILEIKPTWYIYIDADGDLNLPLIWWFVDSNYVKSLDNQTSIPANETHPGQTWYYIIQPFDGTDYGENQTSTVISIESRPQIHAFNVTALRDTEGHYHLEVNVTDSRNNIREVIFLLTLNDGEELAPFVVTSPIENGSSIWGLDYGFSKSYLETSIFVKITVVTEVMYSTSYEIDTSENFTFMLEDKAPPRIREAWFVHDLNPTNISFYAEVQEYGAGISQVILYYSFLPANDTESPGGIGANLLQQDHQIQMTWHNETDTYVLYSVTIPFKQNGTNWKVIYRISTRDNNGNEDPYAFDILRDDPDKIDRSMILYNPPGIDPTLVIIIVAITVLLAFIGSIIYVKFIRKPELVGLDKELVLAKISDLPEMVVMEALDAHTLGVVISFFDQRHGPIPIIIIPELLKDNFNKLVDLSDRSFSGTGFCNDFETEILSSYDFVLAHGLRTSVLSVGFALDRPESRGGQENITCNIIVHQDLFPLVESFKDNIKTKVHIIHNLMNDATSEKEKIRDKVAELRKFVTSIILSYEQIYGTTELLSEEN